MKKYYPASKILHMLSANELRAGVVFKYEGKTWVVLKYNFIKMGRQSGSVKIKARDLMTNAIVEKGFNLNMKFEEASVEKKSGQYLYSDSEYAYFMDNETFDQIQLPLDIVEDLLRFIPEGNKVILVYLDGRPITIEIPKSVSLKVIYTEPAVKGDTSNSPMKKAKLETNAEILVPLFVNIGDIVKVNTETGEYSERIK